jgi:signal transduction histidine kinase
LATLPPTPAQRRLALAVAAVLLAVFAITVPFAPTPLPEVDAFIPAVQSSIIVTDLITSVLLFAQFSVTRSRALLVLASGYLFTALMVLPHMLTFPGVFAPAGLLGAGLQTTVWLYIFWHLGFPVAVCGYMWLRNPDRAAGAGPESVRTAIGWSVAIVVGLACGLTVLTTAGHDLLPRIFLDRTRFSLLSDYFAAFNLLVGLVALAALLFFRRSILDLWLIIVVVAWLAEHMFAAILTSARFELGWYAGRVYSLITATVVLIVMLAEITGLYARIARSNMLLQQERNSTLMSMEALAASVAHEVRQPLAAISLSGGSALRFLRRSPPELAEVEASLKRMIDDSHRASDVFDSVRTLFRRTLPEAGMVDVNELVLEALRSLRRELDEHGITQAVALTAELPPVKGHKGQLQEVVLNLMRNAIEAMESVGGQRVLRVTSERRNHDSIVVAVEDSGPGIDPSKVDTIFDAFVSTKPQGMGLGLALCKLIVTRHGGSVSASSGKQGGALMRFTLPVASAASSTATA